MDDPGVGKIQQYCRYALGTSKLWFDNNSLVRVEDQIELPDQISGLPDDVLALVFSQLSLKETARSSVLSHRWRHLYWKVTTNLNFDEGSQSSETCCLDKIKHSDLVKHVNEILDLKEAGTVKQLRIRLSLDKCFKQDIDNWVEFVFSKRVQKFDLDLLVPNRTNDDYYALTPDLFSRIEGTCFRSLEELRLRDVDINEELVNFLGINCPNLERLSIIDSPSLFNFKITGGSHSMLKYLELAGQFESVEISDVSNLVCLSLARNHYESWPPIDVRIENAPSLIDLRIGGGFAYCYMMRSFDYLFTNLACSLKSLTLRITSNVCYYNLDKMPTMSALEKLVVQTTSSSYGTSSFAYFTRSFPSLQEFLFQAAWHDSMNIPDNIHFWDRRHFRCEGPKEVKIFGYYGCSRDVDIVSYFLKYCAGLERIIIDPHDQNNVLFDLPPNDCDTNREEAARSRAKEQFQGRVPAGVELVIL